MGSRLLERGYPRHGQYKAALVQPHEVQGTNNSLLLVNQDLLLRGVGGQLAYDYPNPTLPKLYRGNRGFGLDDVSVTTLLSQDLLLRGTALQLSYDYPNPTLPKLYRGNRTYTLDDVSVTTLLGQDLFFGAPGEAPTYDQPNPTRARRTLQPDIPPSLLGTVLGATVAAPFLPLDYPVPAGPDARGRRRSQENLAPTQPVRGLTATDKQSLANPTATSMNTTFTNDLSEDGFSWAQAGPSFDDKHGNQIVLVQRYNSGTRQMNFAWSNDRGATWTDAGIAEGAIGRGATAYDGARDIVHVAYLGSAATDGIFYRRYQISYTAGTKQISGIARLDAVSMVIDGQTTGTMEYQHPVALFCDDPTMFGAANPGTLLVLWGARNSGGGGGVEVRAACRVLSYDTNDGTAANWRHIGFSSTTSIGNAPATATYSVLHTNATDVVAAWPAAGRKTWSGSGYGALLVPFARVPSGGTEWWRAYLDFSSSAGWSLNTVGLVEAGTRSGTDAGYSLKYQLVSKVTGDRQNDQLYFGYPVWASDAAGDTWVVRSHAAASTSFSSPRDVYSAGGSNTDGARDMFVAGDVQWDEQANCLVVSYGDLARHDVYLATFTSGLLPIGPPPLAIQSAFTTAPCDIPTLHPARVGGKCALVFRDFNAGARNNPPTYTPPYHGWFLTLDFVAAPPVEGLVYADPSAQRILNQRGRRGLADLVANTVVLAPTGPTLPEGTSYWLPNPPRGPEGRTARQAQWPWTPLSGQDLFYGAPGEVPAYDYPVPKGYRRPVQPEIPPSLLGTTLFVVPEVPLLPYDYPNPVPKPAYRENRTHVDTGEPTPLLGLDLFYGAAGQAITYDWQLPPKGRPPGVVTNRSWMVDLATTTLRSQDLLLRGVGQQLAYDYPNPRGYRRSHPPQIFVDLINTLIFVAPPDQVPAYAVGRFGLTTWVTGGVHQQAVAVGAAARQATGAGSVAPKAWTRGRALPAPH